MRIGKQMAEEDQSGAREGFAHVVCPEIVRQIDTLTKTIHITLYIIFLYR